MDFIKCKYQVMLLHGSLEVLFTINHVFVNEVQLTGGADGRLFL
jgi:hypothetical protein